MRKEFKNPTNQYRPIPFWSWNDKLEKEEIKNQINEMKKGGMGGYFMHARSGLKTEYLSQEWFDCIDTGIDCAKEQDMHAWIYDEEGWPSGFAGGIVPDMSVDYQAKFMTIAYHDNTKEIVNKQELLAVYLLTKDPRKEGQYIKYQKLDAGEEACADTKTKIAAVRKHINPYYVDTLNQRAITAFLNCTHEVYAEKFGEAFGTHMLGFFTDEPRLTCNNFGDLAWSDDLPGNFREQYGYDILDHLPSLYNKIPGYEKYRYDFWETVSRMFAQHYMKTIFDWCESHNCKATGHIMMEESIFSQMTSTAGVMPFYEYLHVPGIDWLRRTISSPVIGKQVGSVACQLGKKQVLTESYALCGWDVNFEELKWIAEWQFVNGVNQICQHLMAYTLRGVRKRDYPPSHFTQQSWWGDAALFNDYLSRLCVALSEGDQTADVLLIHPMRSGYLAFDGTRTEEIRLLDDEFTRAAQCLSGEHISYHFGDETIIEKYGRVQNACFCVGRISYPTVILPHMLAVNKKTLELLMQFTKEGGTIVSLGEFPRYTNGDMEDLSLLKNRVQTVDVENLRAEMESKKLVSLSVSEDGKEIDHIHYLQRDTEEGTLYYLVNLSQERRHQAKIRILSKRGKLTSLCAVSGESEDIPYFYEGDNTCTMLTFEPMQSCLILCTEGDYPEMQKEEVLVQRVSLAESFDVKEFSENVMTLDTCRYRIDQGEWQEKMAVIHIQNLLMEMQRSCEVELCFDFEIKDRPEVMGEFCAVVEDASHYEIRVNGEAVETQEQDWWKDKSFHKVNIRSLIRQGKNEILLKTRFHQPRKVYEVLYGENVYETEKNKITYEVELESIYLIGDFGVKSCAEYQFGERKALVTKGPFVITKAPRELSGHVFTKEGFLFFAGVLVLEQKLTLEKRPNHRIILDLGGQKAPLAKIFVNGRHVKDSLWAPYEADITDYVTEEENVIRLQLYASNRNMLGPHHHIDGECYNVGPESFTGKWSWVERKSEADATDIADREKNYWTQTYCFTEFGI